MAPAPQLPPRPAVRVVTVDDSERFLYLAREVIAATPGFEAVGEAADGLVAVAVVAALRPDMVLMDVRMPRLGGVEAARRIVEDGTTRLVVFLSSEPLDVLAELEGATAMCKEHLRPQTLRRLWERRAQPEWPLAAAPRADVSSTSASS